jgi:Calcineurin-like phosphoesterase
VKFDVIGDVHGEFGKLVALLSKLGYSDSGGIWRHHSRKAVFVGDLIDRGANQLAVVNLVRNMVDADEAHCILGNHEFNAIAWATENPQHPGKFLRDHDRSGNREQHAAFLAEVKKEPSRHAETVAWFKTLPLWLDFGDLRVVHACWDQSSIDTLNPLLGPNQTLTDQLIEDASNPEHDAYKAVEIVCKGPEVRLPDGVSIKDKEGKDRDAVRVAWWHEDLSTFREAVHIHHQYKHLLPDGPLPELWHSFTYSGPPVVFGHYWFTGTPEIKQNKQFGCVDYSIANGGLLVAYRWDGESELSTSKMAFV